MILTKHHDSTERGLRDSAVDRVLETSPSAVHSALVREVVDRAGLVVDDPGPAEILVDPIDRPPDQDRSTAHRELDRLDIAEPEGQLQSDPRRSPLTHHPHERLHVLA